MSCFQMTCSLSDSTTVAAANSRHALLPVLGALARWCAPICAPRPPARDATSFTNSFNSTIGAHTRVVDGVQPFVLHLQWYPSPFASVMLCSFLHLIHPRHHQRSHHQRSLLREHTITWHLQYHASETSNSNSSEPRYRYSTI